MASRGVVEDDLLVNDDESSLNALLSQLGPDKSKTPVSPRGAAAHQKSDSGVPGEAVGGLVNCVLQLSSGEVGEDGGRRGGGGGGGGGEGRSGQKKIQLQRIASRCHCEIIYVTYGGEVEGAQDLLSVSVCI